MKRSHVVIATITMTTAAILVTQTPAAESVTNYFDQTKVVTAKHANVATCPAGWKVTGGGYADVPQTYNFQTDKRFESVQILRNAPKGNNAWEVQGLRTESHYYSEGQWLTKGYPLPLTVYAICTR